MTATAGLTTDLQKQVLLLEDDVRSRLHSDPERLATWQAEHATAVQRERTASSWVEWRDDRVTQVAVAWVLTTVFVRFCEDNGLVKPVWIAGPAERRQEALDAQLAFFRAHPEDTDREWLREAVDYLSGMPSTATLVDSHSALHSVSPSGDAATALLAFWRRKDDNGELVHDLTDPTLSTRFLGDLYQDLSEYAKKTFALLQTPVFVEEFILDRTLEPALAERPLEGFRMIDPTCGSGHFLLGAFDRLLDRWQKHAPAMEKQALVQQALEAIHGVDLNPFAVAIARFRLTLASMEACGLRSLESAPAFRFHLAVGDSLLHGPGQPTLAGDVDLSGFAYSTEDLDILQTILAGGRYDAVVGNPPYNGVADPALRKAYRDRYSSCSGKYVATVPFMERFFGLAKRNSPNGWVGQITSNSFMKREFGATLIEHFLVRMDLRLVIDTSGVYIPGGGFKTPTVILIGRHGTPTSGVIRTVLGVRAEPGKVADPAQGNVWKSLAEHWDEPGWGNAWVSVTNTPREVLARHPWTLSGGGAAELRVSIESACQRRLSSVASEVGIVAVVGEEEAFELPARTMDLTVATVPSDSLRDYEIGTETRFWPYDERLEVSERAKSSRWLWPFRRSILGYVMFGKTRTERGLAWCEYGMLAKAKLREPRSLAFPEVASHNHFVFDRTGLIFKQTAPVVKLRGDAVDADYIALLGVLNSSTVCFWLKQVCQRRGGDADQSWLRTYQFNSTNVRDVPLPNHIPALHATRLESLSRECHELTPEAVIARGLPAAGVLEAARAAHERVRSEMIWLQEELDWEMYACYGLITGDMTYAGDAIPGLLGTERAFAIHLAREIASGVIETTWFTDRSHNFNPVLEPSDLWPADYRDLVQRRLDLIVSDPVIGLLEKPEYKRRWASEPWEKRQERALRGWLLDRLEDKCFWFDTQGRPQPRSVAQLADEVARDADLPAVLALWEGRPDVPVSDSLVQLLGAESVPYLAAYRLKDSGLRKREAWEQTWALQRREDAGEKVGPIPVPPKYTNADFRLASAWQARGKLDVPKERFILYPDAGRETDPTPLLGWAGWDHAQQSLALSLVIGAREADGWDDDRLVPLVAGLAELQPWVEQWHADVDPAYGVSLAAFCREQLSARATQVGKSLEELAAWRPTAQTRGRKPKGA